MIAVWMLETALIDQARVIDDCGRPLPFYTIVYDGYATLLRVNEAGDIAWYFIHADAPDRVKLDEIARKVSKENTR